MGGRNSSCFGSAKVDTAKPEDSIDDLDLSTKPIEKSSVLDATLQRSESSAVPGAAPIIWTWTNRSTIRYNSDIYDPSICGCCFMENGDLVLCDTRNQLIKTFSNTTSVFLPDCPFDVAALNDNTAVVTLPWLKKLQLITVLPRLQKGSFIDIDKQCWGIDVVGDKIYVACCTEGKTDAEIRIFGFFGSLINNFSICNIGSRVLKSPKHICVNKSGSKLFVTDPETDTVLCMTTDGKLIYEYRHEELKSPRGLCVDENDNVFVCAHGSKNIQAIAADGKTENTLLCTIWLDPLSIAYRSSDGQVAIGCDKSDDMLYLNASCWSV